MVTNIAVSVVLPAYNEENTLADTVETTLSTLDTFNSADEYEVIIAEDGCDDATPAIADTLEATYDRVQHFHSDQRLGRGGALNEAFRDSSGEVLVYFDTDLATDMQHVEPLVERVRTGHYDIATGSRWLSESEADRPIDRRSASWAYNRLVKLVLRSGLEDHQCGFKAFDRDVLLKLLADVENDHWFWDTEVLVRAQARGFDVAEIPVSWTPKGDTKVQLVDDAARMGSEILRLRWDLSVKGRLERRPSPAGQS